MGTLQAATRLRSQGAGFIADLDPAWEGWGPAGGYLAALALRAAGRALPRGQRPVTLTCQFLARAQSGPASVSVEVAKPGGSACVNVAMTQGERRFFQAQLWTTARTHGPEAVAAIMPTVAGPDELEPLEHHFARLGRTPVTFWANLDCRPVEFRAPGGPAARRRRLERWYRFRGWEPSDDPFVDAGRAAVLVDANIWAAHWRLLDAEPDYAGPSLDLAVWFHDSGRESAWLLLDAEADVAREGLVHGTARVWSADGRLIASGGSQCLVVPLGIKPPA